MGGAASFVFDSTAAKRKEEEEYADVETVSAASSLHPYEYVKQMATKPLDASDIENFKHGKQYVILIRSWIKSILDDKEPEFSDIIENETQEEKDTEPKDPNASEAEKQVENSGNSLVTETDSTLPVESNKKPSEGEDEGDQPITKTVVVCKQKIDWSLESNYKLAEFVFSPKVAEEASKPLDMSDINYGEFDRVKREIINIRTLASQHMQSSKKSKLRFLKLSSLKQANKSGKLCYELLPKDSFIEITASLGQDQSDSSGSCMSEVDELLTTNVGVVSWRYTFDKKKLKWDCRSKRLSPTIKLETDMIKLILERFENQVEYIWLDWSCMPQFKGYNQGYINVVPYLFEKAKMIVFYEKSNCRFLNIGNSYLKRVWPLCERMARNKNDAHVIKVVDFLKPDVEMPKSEDIDTISSFLFELYDANIIQTIYPDVDASVIQFTLQMVSSIAGVSAENNPNLNVCSKIQQYMDYMTTVKLKSIDNNRKSIHEIYSCKLMGYRGYKSFVDALAGKKFHSHSNRVIRKSPARKASNKLLAKIQKVPSLDAAELYQQQVKVIRLFLDLEDISQKVEDESYGVFLKEQIVKQFRVVLFEMLQFLLNQTLNEKFSLEFGQFYITKLIPSNFYKASYKEDTLRMLAGHIQMRSESYSHERLLERFGIKPNIADFLSKGDISSYSEITKWNPERYLPLRFSSNKITRLHDAVTRIFEENGMSSIDERKLYWKASINLAKCGHLFLGITSRKTGCMVGYEIRLHPNRELAVFKQFTGTVDFAKIEIKARQHHKDWSNLSMIIDNDTYNALCKNEKKWINQLAAVLKLNDFRFSSLSSWMERSKEAHFQFCEEDPETRKSRTSSMAVSRSTGVL